MILTDIFTVSPTVAESLLTLILPTSITGASESTVSLFFITGIISDLVVIQSWQVYVFKPVSVVVACFVITPLSK